jgi:hypothetical protein
MLATTALVTVFTSLPLGGVGKRSGAWIETWHALEGNYIWQSELRPGNTKGAPSNAAALVDVNGDGLDDAVVWGSSAGPASATSDVHELVVALSTGTTFTQPVQLDGVGCSFNSTVNFGDANGDGRADMLCVVASKGFYIAQGSFVGAPWFEPLALWSSAAPPTLVAGQRWLVDVNNDSRADVVEWVPAPAPSAAAAAAHHGTSLQVHLSKGTGFSDPAVWMSSLGNCSSSNSNSTAFAADVNKDGCSDFICVTEGQQQQEVCWMVGLSDCQSGFGDMMAWKCGPLPQQHEQSSSLARSGLPLHLQKYSAALLRKNEPVDDGMVMHRHAFLMADVDLDGVADALYFDPNVNSGTWYVALSDGKSAFATWTIWMGQHGRSFVHSKPTGTAVATNVFVGMPFARNFSARCAFLDKQIHSRMQIASFSIYAFSFLRLKREQTCD